MEFQKSSPSRRPRIPGLLVFDLPVHGDNRGWFKENWQREKMLAAGSPRLRAGAEQHLLQRQGRNHPRHPRRAVGQVRLGRHADASSAPGSTCARARPSARSSPPSWTPARRSSCRAASATPTRPWKTTPRTSTSSTTTGPRMPEYTFLNLADETVASRGRSRWTRPSSRTRTRPTRGCRTSSRCRRGARWCWAPADSWARRCGLRTPATRAWSSPTAVTSMSPIRRRLPAGTGGGTPPSSTRPPTPRWMKRKRTRGARAAWAAQRHRRRRTGQNFGTLRARAGARLQRLRF